MRRRKMDKFDEKSLDRLGQCIANIPQFSGSIGPGNALELIRLARLGLLYEDINLRELLDDLADDAGYNLAHPPEHYCPNKLGRTYCTTCNIHKRLAALTQEKRDE
jgi:hypothetical protein